MRLNGSMIVVALAAALVGAAISRSLAQSPATAGPGAGPASRPARIEGHPNLSGIWQANNEAHWDLQAHAARAGAVTQPGVYPFEYARVAAAPVVALGAAAGVPASLGVVQDDGEIPYTPEALAIRKANAENWIDRDPELKCYLPGIPRAMYMPYPFEITQSTNKIHMAYAIANTARTIHIDAVDPPPAETWMGHSVGRWEGDTLVVDVTSFNDKTWFDRAGNFHSEALHLTERFTPLTPDVIQYEVTIEDPKVFTRPWRIAMPLYRRMEPNIQLLEYRCTEFAEEFLYGHVRKEPLVTRWEGETMIVEITRKVPPGDRFYEWLRK
ncbi:MAG: hypothetical protein HYU37_20395 [Acidobacteria bacterium]|nr:hypothetical protein [Acidobacteriota bacterium]